MFKVAIIGGEYTGNYSGFKKVCIKCLENKVKTGRIMIYTIGDKFVEAFAERFGISTHFFGADFKSHGKDALKIRAENMLKDCDAVISFDTNIKDIELITKMAVSKGLPIRKISQRTMSLDHNN